MATPIFSQRFRSTESGGDGGSGSASEPGSGKSFNELNHPDGGYSVLEHVATSGALRNRYGIPVPAGILPTDPSTAVQVVDSDGHAWSIWSRDNFFVHACRKRTPEELVAWIDSMNSRISTDYFSKDRQMMCYEISWALMRMALAMRPEHPMTRAARRKLKKTVEAFADVQMELTVHPRVDMAEMRRRLADVGLVVTQPRFVN
jgi:hypothetical protein